MGELGHHASVDGRLQTESKNNNFNTLSSVSVYKNLKGCLLLEEGTTTFIEGLLTHFRQSLQFFGDCTLLWSRQNVCGEFINGSGAISLIPVDNLKSYRLL